MQRAFSLRSPLLWALTLTACVVASCDEKGITSVCPPLPLYESFALGDASRPDAESPDSATTEAAFAAAVDAGCATAPRDFPSDASAGAAGDGSQPATAEAGGSAAADVGAAGAF